MYIIRNLCSMHNYLSMYSTCIIPFAVSKISDVFTTVQIKQHSSNKPEYAQSFSYTGICYGAIESLDVHSDDWRRCISLKWLVDLAIAIYTLQTYIFVTILCLYM